LVLWLLDGGVGVETKTTQALQQNRLGRPPVVADLPQTPPQNYPRPQAPPEQSPAGCRGPPRPPPGAPGQKLRGPGPTPRGRSAAPGGGPGRSWVPLPGLRFQTSWVATMASRRKTYSGASALSYLSVGPSRTIRRPDSSLKTKSSSGSNTQGSDTPA